ncbi:hypothetical protein BDV40DRAFT_301852 [Aspergillus tamarii]|uniref:Ketoreductase (KR) domain-containing protein n=1 Tax=Aspergillus tamarii TaxID=41984 RepID=A0A5N6UQG0_ASPTM|nr:hypothetical protein BDV40DRAFT_301852 [Aspergillus tamarii]
MSAVFATYAQDMPPIRGSIQGAVVLRDSLFDTKRWKDFEGTIQPKARGS